MEYMAKTFHYLITFTRKEIFSASQNLLSEKKKTHQRDPLLLLG